jgi:hypothetical protein
MTEAADCRRVPGAVLAHLAGQTRISTAASVALPDFHRPIFALLLFGAFALTGCASTESDTPVSLNMAPTSGATEDVGFAVSLPDSTDILPTSSGLVSQADATSPADGAVTATAQAEPSDPVTTSKQGRLVATTTAMRTALPEKNALAPDAKDDGEVKVAALGEEQPRKSLAQSAISLVSFVKPDEPRNDVDGLIEKYAELYEVPVALVRRVVKRESNFRPWATNRGHYGLMQIKPATARSMGYNGSARGLLDAETNLKYAVKYLRGAYLVAQGNHDRADRLYQSGYYYHAKRMGLLEETGLGKDRRRRKS